MSRKARHLQLLEDSKRPEYNIDKPSKVKGVTSTIEDARYDEARERANMYAKSLNMPAPNMMSYEKRGGKTRRRRNRRKNKKSRRARRY